MDHAAFFGVALNMLAYFKGLQYTTPINGSGQNIMAQLEGIIPVEMVREITIDFLKVKIRLVDYPNMKPFETVLLLDTINLETPSLSYERANELYQEVLKD